MKAQHEADENLWFDIIQINSKSGLEGSKNNSAYAGGKFGGIGLTQSFALELVGANIKVNSICPGNFYDGPLWSDPERGLFVQYLNAGKVPGAKTVQDVLQTAILTDLITNLSAAEARTGLRRRCICIAAGKGIRDCSSWNDTIAGRRNLG